MSDEEDGVCIRLGEHSLSKGLVWTIGKDKEGKTVLKPPGAEYYEKRITGLEDDLKEAKEAVCEACFIIQEAYGFCALGEAKCPVQTKQWSECPVVGPGFRKRVAQSKTEAK